MSDFGASTSDFDSDYRAELIDYANDFRTEGNDYASDFCDFTGDSNSDFNREVRHSRSRADGMAGPDPAAAETEPPEIDSRRDRAAGGAQERRQAGSASGKPRSSGQRHPIGTQTRRTAHAERRQYSDSAKN